MSAKNEMSCMASAKTTIDPMRGTCVKRRLTKSCGVAGGAFGMDGTSADGSGNGAAESRY